MPSEPYIGEIYMMGITFAPSGYLFCQGQTLTINAYQALYALVGTTFGGDGRTTFMLPDLRGRVPIGAGQGTGLSNYTLGQKTGTETVTLTVDQMPAHTHILNASNDPGDVANPAGAFPANTGALDKEYKAALTNSVTMNGSVVSSTGSSLPFPVIQPSLVLNFCIAVTGLFPSRP